MAEFRIDRLRFNWKGSWDAATVYKKDDVISYAGKTYVCLQEHTSQNNFYNDLISTNTTQTIIVTVSTDNLYSQDHGVFYINGVERPNLNLLKGKTYVFNQDQLSNKEFNEEIHPFLFSTFENGTKNGGPVYNNAVTYYLENTPVTQEEYLEGFAGSNFRKVEITVPVTGIKELYYFSPNNDNMGGKFSIHYASNWELMFDGFAWRGDWERNTRYNLKDLVKYNGYIYQCDEEHTSTDEEAENIADEILKWTIFSKGSNWRNTWSIETYYHVGDVVTYNGIVYIANSSHLSSDDEALGLEADQLSWDILSRSDNWLTDWTIETRYRTDDLVKYGGRVYRATDGHTSADNLTDGLEADEIYWEIVSDGVEYKGNWGASQRYKAGDVVKSSHSLWRASTGHTSTTSLRQDEQYWELYVLGVGFENEWNLNTEYGQGDIVRYGGYTYVALTNNSGIEPSVNGELQNTGAWELLTRTYSHQGDWDGEVAYKTGEVVRVSGYLYIAKTDSQNVHPDSNPTAWQLLVSGDQWRAEWNDNTTYSLGDIVTYRSTAYVCILRHVSSSSDSRPDLDAELDVADYWIVLVQGTPTNILSDRGDIKVFDGTDTARLAISTAGKVLKSNGTQVEWSDYDVVPNVYYVATNGTDLPTSGTSLSSPFASVAYACAYILEDEENRTPATVFIKTGTYSESLPIRVPKDTALVGDELRSTVIQPFGDATSDMFRVRNGSGIRNMTLQGLTGTLGEPNEYLTRRPTAGAFVALDPGQGQSDESVWITTKSCYVQNVSAFGTGCIGMKIDGSLHAGGNKSIVANDFTQIISDGIGYWAASGGRSELVSVFTYYCHIGYLATDGGILRATNGNNSYGTYGSVAEGFNTAEVPINGTFNNRDNEATIDEVITFGTTDLEVLAVGYSHAGQDYTSADITFGGSGQNAAGAYTEFRNGAISNLRLIDPGDSSIPGGFDYQFVSNTAQGGSDTSITLAQADVKTEADYIGMRIVIQSGKGVGQYAQIAGFDEVSKVVTPARESDGSLGWDHFNPGWPIETTLDETTRYSIEPRVDVEEKTFSISVNNGMSGNDINPDYIAAGGGSYLISGIDIDGTGSNYYLSTNGGGSWTNVLNGSSGATDVTQTAWTGSVFISLPIGSVDIYVKIQPDGTYTFDTQTPFGGTDSKVLFSDGNGYVYAIGNTASIGPFVAYVSDDHGDTWGSASPTILSSLASFEENFNYFQAGAASTYGTAIILASDGLIGLSIDYGSTWTTSSPLSTASWTDITYGNGRFVAVGELPSGDTIFARSFDGVNWYEETVITPTPFTSIQYGEGMFMSFGQSNNSDENRIGFSAGGDTWRLVDSDSSVFAFNNFGQWSDAAYGDNGWIAIENLTTNLNQIDYGTRPVVRAKVANTRITDLLMYDPGSNYSSAPSILIYDNNNSADAVFDIFMNDGVLAQPEMSNRGEGYVAATAQVTGDGFAEIYQTGKLIKVTNLSDVPGVGANLEIDGITDRRYSVSKIEEVIGTGPYTATITITPTLGVAESPLHNTSFIIREQYSQIRLTGHDFLDIGTGNFNSTRYPDLYLEGEDAENERQPFNETVDSGGGRVFYTSTDQDGNFRVGELFQVEQARGVVTISASQFDLGGLSELSLGGIQVGGSAVVIKEFSKDDTFIANSNNIVPTQAAIKSYVESRISGGGSNASTNTLIAGQIQITGTEISTVSGLPINITPLVNMSGGFTGSLLAQQYMTLGVNTQFE